METINQIIRYIGAINANAFVAIVYWISSNFAAFISIACFVLLAVFDIREKSSQYITDGREIV